MVSFRQLLATSSNTMDRTQTLLVVLIVSLSSSEGITETPTKATQSTHLENETTLLQMMCSVNNHISGMTATATRVDKMITAIMKRLDDMNSEMVKRFDEMDTRVKSLEITTTNSSEIMQSKYLALSKDMEKVLTRVKGQETRTPTQCTKEVELHGKEKQFVLFTSLPKTWYDAFNDCIKSNMSLATIENEEENNKVVSLIKATDKDWFWLSGTDNGHNGKYVWEPTGRDVLYNQWAHGQPDNYAWVDHGVDHCMDVRRDIMKWHDAPCGILLSYICHHWV